VEEWRNGRVKAWENGRVEERSSGRITLRKWEIERGPLIHYFNFRRYGNVHIISV